MLLLSTLGRFLACELWRWPAALIFVESWKIPDCHPLVQARRRATCAPLEGAGREKDVVAWDARFAPASLAELWSSFPTVQALLGPPLCAGAENVYIDMGTNIGRHITMLYHPQRFGFIGEYRNWFGSCGWADRGDKAKVCGNATVVRERLANVCVMSFEPSPMHPLYISEFQG